MIFCVFGFLRLSEESNLADFSKFGQQYIVIFNYDLQNCRKIMHFAQENDLKPHFGPFLVLNDPFLGPEIYFQQFDHYQILYKVTLDHDTQNRRKVILFFDQENGLKPQFGSFFVHVWTNTFFSINQKRHFSRLISG